MPTDPEDLRIANQALSRLGLSKLTDFADVNPIAAILDDQYTQWVNELVQDHPWNFAIGRALLTVLNRQADPLYEYGAAHALPSNSLRILQVGEEHDEIDWKIEGNRIVHNEGDDISIKYIKVVTMPTLVQPIFKRALVFKLAMDLAEAGIKTATVMAHIEQQFQSALARAKSADGQEGSPSSQKMGSWAIEMGRTT